MFVEEPATANPLFGHPNVVATPHLGASTTEAQENVALQVAEQMSDYLTRGAITNAVNFPSITAEEAPKLKPFIALAEGLGSFAGQLTEAPIEKVTIIYEGAVAELKTKALTSAAIAGLLRPSLADVNVVSAPSVAAQRGIVIEEVTRAAEGDYESFITLTVDDRGTDALGRRHGLPRRQAAHPVDQGHQGRRRIHALDDLCHQRGQAGLHRPLRQPARRAPASISRPSRSGATSRAARRSRWCRSTGHAPPEVIAKVSKIKGVRQVAALRF